MIGSTYAPSRWADIEAQKVRPNIMGIQDSADGSTTTTMEQLISDDSIIREIEIAADTANFGDTITLSVVDKDGVYFAANTVISVVANEYNVRTDTNPSEYQAVAPFKIPGGVYIRCVYTNTGSDAVLVAINFHMLTVLL